jgi:TRAP-type C4-dicarboxylate transport system permease small subunit
MHRLIHIIDGINVWLARISAVVLGLMTALVLLEIFLWNVFEKTTLIADEYSAYGLAAIIFMAAGFTLKQDGHIRINLVLNFLPVKAAQWISAGAYACTTVFMGYVWWFLYKMVAAAFRYGSTSGTLTETPLWVPMSCMLLGAAAFLLQLVATTLRSLQTAAGED